MNTNDTVLTRLGAAADFTDWEVGPLDSNAISALLKQWLTELVAEVEESDPPDAYIRSNWRETNAADRGCMIAFTHPFGGGRGSQAQWEVDIVDLATRFAEDTENPQNLRLAAERLRVAAAILDREAQELEDQS